MFHPRISLLTIIFFEILLIPSFAQNTTETIELATYYPAPYGAYAELTTTNSTYLATEGGKVGIGTTDPSEKLHVHDPDKNAVVRITSNSGDRAGYHLSATSSTGPGYAVYHDANDDTFHINYDTTLGTATQWLITGTNDGKVMVGGGAGGAIPKATLDVVGGIKVGDDLEVCNDDKAGTMRYSAGQMEYCNGSGWMQMGGGTTSLENGLYGVCKTSGSLCDSWTPPTACSGGICSCDSGYSSVKIGGNYGAEEYFTCRKY